MIAHDLTWYETRPIGDSNGDGRFDSADLVRVFAAAEYEDDLVGNSTFEDGDWNGDGEFDSSDLVAVFSNGTYLAAVRNTPEIASELAAAALVDDLRNTDKP